ncbi:MAG: hypothetical protein JJ863_17125 [Deltaproteobacteria bacterium]|nr:hypothetical protein [Deltaproteobacteria bacterium]
MSEPERFWTKPLAIEMLSRLNSDAKFKKLAANVDAVIQLRCKDTPDGTDVCATYHIHDGQLDLKDWDEGPAPAAWREEPLDKKKLLARTTAPYPIWVKLDTGEFGVIDAIINPSYKFEGAKLKVLRHLRMFSRIADLSQELEKRYE